jgi:hypothetical protein
MLAQLARRGRSGSARPARTRGVPHRMRPAGRATLGPMAPVAPGPRVLRLAAITGAALVLRRRQLRWGATSDEVTAALPGDERLPTADLVATRAITVRAPIAEVWPWVAQLGQGRGGFYSYDRLENLVGCDVHSADRIVPEWQQVHVGDPFRLHPELALEVARVEPPRVLVVEGVAAEPGAGAAEPGAGAAEPGAGAAEPGAGAAEPAPPYDFTWAFVLVEAAPGSTRLLVRERYRARTGWAPVLVEALSLVSFLMTQRMLRGLRDRAELPPPPAGGQA